MRAIMKREVVSIVLQDEENGGGESVWAESLGEDRYVVRNVPLCTPGLALGDVVFAPRVAPHGVPTYGRVLQRSGNGTLSILFEEDVTRECRRRIFRAVARVGGNCDGESCDALALNLDRGTPVGTLVGMLRTWKEAGILRFSLFDPLSTESDEPEATSPG